MRLRALGLSLAAVLAVGGGCQCGTSTGTTGGKDSGSGDGGSGDAGSGDGGGGGDSGDQGDGGNCGSSVLQGSLVPGNVMVVFDQSDSMNQKFGDAGPKWQVASNALIAAITPIAFELNVGAIFQPTAGEMGGVCPPVAPISQAPQIPFADGGTFISEWNAHFLPPWKLLLGTPLGDALNQVDSALAVPPPGKTAVLVMTDGQPNCGETLTGILVPVQNLLARGIKTYVVGLPGAQGATVLMDIADAGGTGNYLLPSNSAQLQAELAQIATQALDQCTFTLNPAPPDPNQVHLVVTLVPSGNQVQIAQDAGGGGWTLTNGLTVTLLGNTCATAEDGGYSTISFDYGCVTVPFQ